MKQKLFTLLTLLVLCVTGAWAQDFTYALSSFTVTNTTYTYEFSSENALKNKTAWVEVPSSASEGTITFKGSADKADRFLYIYKTNGTIKDETRRIVMNSSWPTAINFTSSDIKSNEGKYYLVFSTTDDFKTKGVKYTLTDPSGLEISPASGTYAGNVSVTMSANDGYTIYYTDNGSEPTQLSTVYAGSFDVTSNKTIKAIAYKGEDHGFIQTAEYIIVPENRLYDFTALTSGDLTALQGNTDAFSDDTSNKIISNKVQWNSNTDYALEGSDGTDISVAQYLLFGRSGNNISAGNFKYYYGDSKYVYYNNSSTYVKIPAVKAGQKVILEMSASANRTISATNTTVSELSYTASGVKKLTCIASANGEVKLSFNGNLSIYSIEVRTPVYRTVTYDLNGGTGTTPTQGALEAGEKFTLHDGTTDITAPTGKEFSKWVDQDAAEFDGGAEYTVPAKNVTLTAKWIDYVVKHTITYDANGGTGTMASTLVVEGDDQDLPANTFIKELYGFAGWVANVDVTIGGAIVTAGTLIADEATIENVTGDITLTAQWANAYASTRDFAAITTAGTTASNPIATFMAAGGMFASNLGSSAWETSTAKSGFIGYKLKNSGATIKFRVAAGKAVKITLGNVAADVTLKKDEASSTIDANAGDDAETFVQAFYAADEMIVTLITSSNSTVTLKKIAIYDPEAVSTASGKTYATYVTTNNLDFAAVSDEIKAYVAASAPAAGNITFTGKDEIPASTPILVKTASAGATVYVPVIPSAAAISTNNLVAGTGSAINYNDGGKYNYILTNGQFKPANNSVVAVGKAYLSLDAAAANELTISFDDEDGGVTGIQNLTPALSKGEGVVFDLQGRRVAQPTKGLYIVNGKKVVLK